MLADGVDVDAREPGGDGLVERRLLVLAAERLERGHVEEGLGVDEGEVGVADVEVERGDGVHVSFGKICPPR